MCRPNSLTCEAVSWCKVNVPPFSVCWAGRPERLVFAVNEGWLGWCLWGSAGPPGCWEPTGTPGLRPRRRSLPSWRPERSAWSRENRRSLCRFPWPPTASAPSAGEHPAYWCTPHRPEGGGRERRGETRGDKTERAQVWRLTLNFSFSVNFFRSLTSKYMEGGLCSPPNLSRRASRCSCVNLIICLMFQSCGGKHNNDMESI